MLLCLLLIFVTFFCGSNCYFSYSVTDVSQSSYTVQNADDAIACYTTNNVIIINLPKASENPGRMIKIVDAGFYTDTHAIIVVPYSGDQILWSGTDQPWEIANSGYTLSIMSDKVSNWVRTDSV
jgi:hypothetical protein